ncbi:toxin-antitoxin system YwqK family antitoxin [Lacinutrix sp. Hel_I_90]|uniref:toxin-antitoxin system YwqK family antitoxin n=1 Tax=Lacinutrix sp. Hel_I_90 TaxID=1249999 RepID=UPI0005CB5CF8|nr:hypothetical protein [Lacinutrix sp. Hel_I_90]
MKIKLLLIILLVVSCGASKESLHQKKIQTTTFKEDFMVTKEPTHTNTSRTYYWYKSNNIQQSKGGYSGDLLHGEYIQYYITNQLAEKGVFNHGLKTKTWKSWFKNGQLKTVEHYSNGKLNGKFELYGDDGNVVTRGRYKNDIKNGKWIDYIAKDTLRYKKGKQVVKDSITIDEKPSFFKRLFKKKETEEKGELKEKTPKPLTQNKKKTVKKEKTQQPKKEPFLKRLFSKKENTNAKG